MLLLEYVLRFINVGKLIWYAVYRESQEMYISDLLYR